MLLPRMGWPRTLAWWQIIGGVMGLLTFVVHISGPSNGSLLIFGALFGGISIMAIRAGVAILRGTPNARRLSIASQVLQLVSFSFGNFVYQIALGPYVVLWYGFERSVKLNLGWTGSFELFFGSAVNADYFVAVNVLSGVVLWFLLDCPATVRAVGPAAALEPPAISASPS